MKEDALKMLRKTSPEGFDGHAAFSEMSLDQRLTWLDEANAAYIERHGLAAPELRVAEAQADYKVKSE